MMCCCCCSRKEAIQAMIYESYANADATQASFVCECLWKRCFSQYFLQHQFAFPLDRTVAVGFTRPLYTGQQQHLTSRKPLLLLWVHRQQLNWKKRRHKLSFLNFAVVLIRVSAISASAALSSSAQDDDDNHLRTSSSRLSVHRITINTLAHSALTHR